MRVDCDFLVGKILDAHILCGILPPQPSLYNTETERSSQALDWTVQEYADDVQKLVSGTSIRYIYTGHITAGVCSRISATEVFVCVYVPGNRQQIIRYVNGANMQTTDHRLERQNVIILCHSDKKEGRRSSGSGPLDPLLHFFFKRQAEWIFVIEQPHPNRDLSLVPTMEVYKNGYPVATYTYERWRFIYDISPERRQGKTYIRLKIRDILAARHFFSIIRKFYKDCGQIDFLFGVESLNALLGDSVRRRLNVRRLIFYIFDWTPCRYANPLMNAIFLFLDRWACYRSDFIWNVASAIEKARTELLKYDKRKMGIQLTVPYGSEFRKDLVRPFDELEKFKIIFAGGFHEDNGVLLLPDIAKRVQVENPNVKFVMAGDGSLFEHVKLKVEEYGLRNVAFTGHIFNPDDLDKLMCDSLIGLAPYPDTLVSTKKYGDVIKIRTYFACGLVVVSTHVPPASREIQAEGLGIVTRPDAKEMADAVLRLCADEAMLRKCRDNVIRKATNWNWTSIYSRAMDVMAGHTRSAER